MDESVHLTNELLLIKMALYYVFDDFSPDFTLISINSNFY